MSRVRYLLSLSSLTALLLAMEGCGKESGGECPAGSDGCPCFNFTCDPGLVCAGNVCQPVTAGSGGITTTSGGNTTGDPLTTTGDPSTTDSGDPSTTDSGDPSTTDTGDPSTTDTGDPSTTDTGDPSTTDSGDPSTTSGGDGDDPCDSFLGCVDVPPVVVMCDFWAQDCPAGEKCTPIASTPGEGAWDAHVCVPAGTEPPGSACTTVVGPDGSDSCDENGMCYDFDPDTGEGTCVEFCQGSPSNPTCPITNKDCKQLNSGILNLCLPGCNPLLAGECPPGENCVAAYEGDTLGGFICFPPAAEGVSGEACECANCCADGHLCTDAATYGPDCAYDLCCTEYCSVSGGNSCLGSGQVCIALFAASDPVYADVGACQIP